MEILVLMQASKPLCLLEFVLNEGEIYTPRQMPSAGGVDPKEGRVRWDQSVGELKQSMV